MSNLGIIKLLKKTVGASASTIVDSYYSLKNKSKEKLLIYTDSRGYDVTNKLDKHAFGSYLSYLRMKYNVTYKICPEKYTTIIDFINYIKTVKVHNYDIIIMHCGIVDFSPRPLSNINLFKKSKEKSEYFYKVFDENKNYYQDPFKCMYNNERTINIYSKEYLASEVILELKKIPNLLWINSNNFVKNWEGNYAKGRPGNIDDVVKEFDEVMKKNLENIINLRDWSPEEVKKYTIDNIHFSKLGFKMVFQLIDKKIKTLVN